MLTRLPRGASVAVLAALALAALTLAAPAAPVALVRGPYLQHLTRTSVTVVWNTDTAAACSLAIRPHGGVSQVIAGDPGTVCTIAVSDLSPATDYAYTPQADGVPLGEESSFRTDGGQSRFSFLVLGDSGTGGAKQAAIRDAMAATPADFILHTGDMVYEDGARDEYDPNFFRPYAPLLRRLMLWPTLGNHDIKTENGAPWREAFGSEEYYSFDFGTAHVAVIDGNDATAPGSPQHTFLAQDLAASAAPWKFVVFHHSIYSSGAHGSDLDIRADLVPLFDQHGVDVVFMGHEHDYERTVMLKADLPAPVGEGTLYVTTGGGGAEVRAVRRSSFTAYAESVFHFVRVVVDDGWLRVQMIRADGVVRDTFVLERGATPPAAVCGDGLVNQSAERCDGADSAACPGACLSDCICPGRCGDGRRNQASEACDRGDDSACPGRCLATCECGAPEQFLTVTPVADTHIVAEDEATWDHGAAPELSIDDEVTAIAYLKFDLSTLAAPVRAASLRLQSTNGSGDGGTVYTIADSSWVEGDRTGTDATSAGGPGLVWGQVDDSGDDKVNWRDTSPLAPDLRRWVTTIGPVTTGTAYTVDVTPAIQSGPGFYTLIIKNDDDNGCRYASREDPDPARRPQLRVELGPVPSCDDGVVCTADRWDPVTGCGHVPVPGCCASDTACDDGNVCTGTETCVLATGACRAGTPLACDDGVVCTTDQCDPLAGCTHTAIAGCCGRDADCADGDACNGVETCVVATGVCRAGIPLVCDDGRVCTADGCDPWAGCTHAPIAGCCARDADCTDGDACNGPEVCVLATHACAAGAPPVCDDGNRCTTDRCEAVAGCAFTPIPGLAGADCTLGALEVARLCAPLRVDPKLARSLTKRVERARFLVVKAMRARSPRLVQRLLVKADRQLAGFLAEARRTQGRRIGMDCLADLERAVEIPRAALAQSSFPVK